MAVTTDGWGAVNAASIDVVNSSILKQGKLPEGFTLTGTASLLEIMKIDCTVAGSKEDKTTPVQWKEWKIIPGGSGSLVYLSCIIGTAYLIAEITTQGETIDRTFDISESSIDISVNLKAVSDSNYNIQGQTGTASKIVADNDKNIQVEDSTDIKNIPEEEKAVIDLVKDCFSDYFNKNLKDFPPVFNVIMLDGKIAEAKKDFQWLMPTAVSYAYEKTSDKDYFGVLTMLDNDETTGLSQQFDTRAFGYMPKDANSVLMISAEKLCKHMLLPSAVSVIDGSKEEDFEIQEDQISITNKNDLTWDNFKIEGGDVVQPVIPAGAFKMKINGTYIEIEILGMHYSPSSGITVRTNMTQKVELTIGRKTDGTIVLATNPKSAYKYNSIFSSVEVENWLKITEIALEITGIVASLACGGGLIASKVASCAATTVAEGTADIAIEGEAIAEAAEESSEESASTIITAAEEVAAGATTRSAGIVASNFCKVTAKVCSLIAAASGAAILITDLIKDGDEADFENAPSLLEFADILLGNYSWPNLNEVKIVDAKLDDVLLIYTNISD